MMPGDLGMLLNLLHAVGYELTIVALAIDPVECYC